MLSIREPSNGEYEDGENIVRLYMDLKSQIQMKLPRITKLNLNKVSTKLLEAKDLQLAIPGSYEPNMPMTKIKSIAPEIDILTSKQKPRKIVINGSDGVRYQYLLKGTYGTMLQFLYYNLKLFFALRIFFFREKFLTAIWIFDRNLDICLKFVLLSKIWIFVKNLYF